MQGKDGTHQREGTNKTKVLWEHSPWTISWKSGIGIKQKKKKKKSIWIAPVREGH